MELDQQTINEILPDYYLRNGFDSDGGKSKDYVKIELLKGVFVYLPNNESRKEVIILHDIHHLVSGYSNDMRGELEISSWELSTGCTVNWVAFVLNINALALGVFSRPRAMWRAWSRGKRTRNLYRSKKSENELRQTKLAEMKALLGFSESTERKSNMLFAVLSFVWFVILSLLISLLLLGTIPFFLIYTIIISQKLRGAKNN